MESSECNSNFQVASKKPSGFAVRKWYLLGNLAPPSFPRLLLLLLHHGFFLANSTGRQATCPSRTWFLCVEFIAPASGEVPGREWSCQTWMCFLHRKHRLHFHVPGDCSFLEEGCSCSLSWAVVCVQCSQWLLPSARGGNSRKQGDWTSFYVSSQ